MKRKFFLLFIIFFSTVVNIVSPNNRLPLYIKSMDKSFTDFSIDISKRLPKGLDILCYDLIYLNCSEDQKNKINDNSPALVLKTVKAYFSFATYDNLNYILDITTSPWYECSLDDILNFTINQISKRQKEFSLFVKVKKYTTTAENLEQYLVEKEFKCIQNQIVLIKDFYRLIKETQPIPRVILFNEINEKPVFKI